MPLSIPLHYKKIGTASHIQHRRIHHPANDIHIHIPTTHNNCMPEKGEREGEKRALLTPSAFPPRISYALKSEKLYYQKLKTIFPTLLSQKRNILLRRKQLLKKSIQQHRIYKSYKSKSKEKPAAYVKWLQLCIKIGHI